MRRPYSFCLALALALAICFQFTPCTHAETGDAAQIVWKTGTLAPKNVGWAIYVDQILVPEIRKASGDKVILKTYWGGIMGDDVHVLEKVDKGMLQGAGLSGGGTFLACREFSVLSLPFLFQSYEEVDYIREKMMDVFDGYMEKSNFALITWADQDFDQVYSITKPLAKAEDFRGVRCINWAGFMENQTMLALSAIPVPTNVPDVAVEIKRDQADGNIGPAIWVVGSQLYSKFRYVNPMKIRYSPVTIVISMDAWNQVDGEAQASIRGIREDITKRFVEKSRAANEKCMEAMVQYGVELVQSTPEELSELKNLTRSVWTDLAGKEYPQPLLQEVRGHLNEFRKGK
ncbi:TRAP-type C4-dicarboxylate transport system, substrate-binding protein [Desulfatibacillum alkenivorans DSM 16219]|jgi:TRAP-type C4-dicarboxylate transport system substrate-binding protein|uniref:TRAP-type C4-dicarboxylate transport system, substrate-binding protein n=1 Tax=Desulfatibacillum alkenivorans DSM 16219 TaxID=1121393 RepID=A0A1M6MTI7_9BACT|nr:TRAP transporter substrate-binding protein DctP [Desulfatibacillum alkenivorans]SHJ86774.1 TRAP-type C4-dicarboxylate transport system, substrate-binding protein [Desulfatibacillum alkenivorans DSM 16219]